MMMLWKLMILLPPLNVHLPNVPWVKKKNDDSNRKFKESWAIKLPWAELCLGLNGNLHIIKCRICNEVEGKDKILLLSGILFISMQVGRKLKRLLELMWRRGSGITPKIVSMLETINCFLFTIDKSLLPNLGMGM
jgi:hypothetical protein